MFAVRTSYEKLCITFPRFWPRNQVLSQIEKKLKMLKILNVY